jgi:hypothetical protein
MRILLLFVLLFPICSKAQSINVLKKSKVVLPKEKSNFRYINKSLDSSLIQFVATIKVSCIKNSFTINNLYNELKTKANELGANAFKVVEYNSKGMNTYLILDVFYANELVLKQNSNLHTKNKLYIFPEEQNTVIAKKQKVFINDSLIVFEVDEYLSLDIQENDSLKIEKSGLKRGFPAIVTKDSIGTAVFLSLADSEKGDRTSGGALLNNTSVVAINMTIKPGQLETLNRNFAYLLMDIFLKEKKIQ